MQSSMKNITVLDTNVILRYVLKDHAEHFKIAQSFMSTVKNGDQTVYIQDSVLAECIYVLLKVYKITKNEASKTLSLLLSYAGISQDNKDIPRLDDCFFPAPLYEGCPLIIIGGWCIQ